MRSPSCSALTGRVRRATPITTAITPAALRIAASSATAGALRSSPATRAGIAAASGATAATSIPPASAMPPASGGQSGT